MHDQPKFKPLAKNDFFADRRSARPLVDGTIARGHLREDAALYTGKADGKPVDTFPVRRVAGGHGPRTGALRHLLLALPRPDRRRRRHDRAARLPQTADVPPGPAAAGGAGLHLRRHHERFRGDARLRPADPGAGPVGDRGLHQGAAAQPARDDRRTCRPPRAPPSSPPTHADEPTGQGQGTHARRDLHTTRQPGRASSAIARHRRHRPARGRRGGVPEPRPVLPLVPAGLSVLARRRPSAGWR